MRSWRRFLVTLAMFFVGVVLPLRAADPAESVRSGLERSACRSEADFYFGGGGWGTPNADISCSGLPRSLCFASQL
jgi:hypothetical protein